MTSHSKPGLLRKRMQDKDHWPLAGKRRRRRRDVRQKKRRRRVFVALPTLLTLANGLCGLASVLVASGAFGQFEAADRLFYAAVWIYVGTLFDMLDGQAARWLKQSSPFGAQLDSLCDVITFGMAPVFLILNFDEILHPRVMLGIASLYIICVLLRLARFNVEAPNSTSNEAFSGLPSPAAAATVASFAVMAGSSRITESSMYQHLPWLSEALRVTAMTVVPMISLLLAWLMVSRTRYPHVVNRWLVKRYGFHHLAQLVVLIAVVLIFHELALPIVFCCFALGPPTHKLLQKVRRRPMATAELEHKKDDVAEAETEHASQRATVVRDALP